MELNSDFTNSTNGLVATNYASLTRRTVAFGLDVMILGILGFIGGHMIPFLGGVLVWFLYAPILESSVVRATVGKHLMGIQVVDLLGRRISLRASLIRNAMKIVSTAFLFFGFVVALFTSRKQSLHDLLADTTVVYGRSDTPVVDAWLEATKEVFRAGKTNPWQTTSPGLVEQLERLTRLRDQGTLTVVEYQAAKKKLLGVD